MAAPDPDEPRTFITKMVLSDDTRATISTLATGWEDAVQKSLGVVPRANDGATLEAWTDEVRRWKLVGGQLVWS